MNEDHDIMPVPKLDCQLSLCMLQSYLIFVTYITYGTGEEMPKSHSQTHTNDQLCIFSNSKFTQLELEARHWCVRSEQIFPEPWGCQLGGRCLSVLSGFLCSHDDKNIITGPATKTGLWCSCGEYYREGGG